ncbi:hypothetical protein D3C77_433520 [compost metagenome]
MQPFAITASSHQAARELIDDNDLVLSHDVVYVTTHNNVRLQRLYDMVIQGDMGMIVQVVDSKSTFRLGDPFLRQRYSFYFNINRKIFFRHKLLNEAVGCEIQLCRLLSLSRDD